MLIIREVFTAKPGMASKLAALFKDVIGALPDMNVRILTDVVGSFNTVVMETAVTSMAEFEQRLKEYASRQDLHDRMKGYADLYETGRREIYRVM